MAPVAMSMASEVLAPGSTPIRRHPVHSSQVTFPLPADGCDEQISLSISLSRHHTVPEAYP